MAAVIFSKFMVSCQVVLRLIVTHFSLQLSIVVTNASIIGGAQMDMSKPAIKNLYLNFTFDNFEVRK